jgi:hypothetical protein
MADKVFRIALVLIGCVVCGCTQEKTVSPDKLPLYGTDPLMHTFYAGSDAHFHYFNTQRGKTPARFKVPIEEAEIKPAPFSVEDQKEHLLRALRVARSRCSFSDERINRKMLLPAIDQDYNSRWAVPTLQSHRTCAVGRTRISFTFTCGGASSAYRIDCATSSLVSGPLNEP